MDSSGSVSSLWNGFHQKRSSSFQLLLALYDGEIVPRLLSCIISISYAGNRLLLAVAKQRCDAIIEKCQCSRLSILKTHNLPAHLSLLLCLLGIAWVSPAVADAPATQAIVDLIQKAGDEDDDKVRLALLKELRALPDLEPDFAVELDSLIKQVDQWIHCQKLMYFYHRVRDDHGWDFGIKEDSSLYPLTFLYRGRMLTWTAFEYSGIQHYPTRRRQVFEEAQWNFKQAARHFPKNRIARMYLGEPIPPDKQYPPVPGAPSWAVYQREGLERLTDIIEWWIKHREQENGEYGGRWADDCEMSDWWPAVMIAFDNPHITAAQERFSKALMNQPHMRNGYTDQMTDVEHSAEPSSKTITPMMYLKPDDPQWGAMSLRLAELMKTRWTGRNQRGFLQFKSTYFSASAVDESPKRACDTNEHPCALMPTLLYWQRTGDPDLTALFTDWMDTWVEATAGTDRGKPAGGLPSAMHWPDGSVGGVGENWWYPENYHHGKFYSWPGALEHMSTVLVLTWHMTGDDKYLNPIRSMARLRKAYLESPPETDPEPGSATWCAAQLGVLSDALAKHRFASGDTEFELLLSEDASPYVNFRLTQNREALIEALRNNAEALRFNFEAYTSEPRYTDKILKFNRLLMHPNRMYRRPLATLHNPTPRVLYQSATGEPGSQKFFPLNAVRWMTSSREIATLVTHADRKHLAAEVFHFGNKPREMGAELYLLEPGDYHLMIAVGDGIWDKYQPMKHMDFTVNGPRTRVSFILPPRRLCTLKIDPI